MEGTVSALLAPYDEELTVAPYATDCWCIGNTARNRGVDAANRTVATIDKLRTRYWNLPKAERPTWDDWMAEWRATTHRVEQTHPFYQKPNPDCEDCQGDGKRMTTYNPNSQWDWWTMGGRWDGWLSRTNRLKAKTVARKSKIPFAVVTPDGAWHDKGKMGWWGMGADEKADADWKHEVRQLLIVYPDATVVTCDLHI